MDGFQVDYDDLVDSSTRLSAAARSAAVVRDLVNGMDLPADPLLDLAPQPFDTAHSVTPFGRSLGMPFLAAAYNQHRRLAVETLGKLHVNTLATARALAQVAALYKDNDKALQSYFIQLHESM